MKKILVLLDASRQALRAIPWADALAGALESDVVLLRSVAWQGLQSPSPDECVGGLRQSIAHAEEELIRASALFRQVHPNVRVIKGKAANLGAAVREEGADLLIMATHGKVGLERVLLGSIVARLVADSGVPVISIGPHMPDTSAAAPRRILAAFDGSEFSGAIFDQLGEIARDLRATVVIFRALPTIQTLPIQGALIPLGNPLGPPVDTDTEDMQRVAESLQAAGVNAEIAAAYGEPAAAIIEAATSERAGLIALATHSRTGPARWVMGSVAERVLADARVPVLLFHPPRAPMSAA